MPTIGTSELGAVEAFERWKSWVENELEPTPEWFVKMYDGSWWEEVFGE